MAEQDTKLTIFTIGEEEYALDIMRVVEILRPQKVTKLPNTPDFIEGVINLRGNVVPIIDLRKRFGIKIHEHEDKRILLTRVGGEIVGLLVDGVKEVCILSKGDIVPPPTMVKGIKTEYLEGVGKAGERLIIILNLDKILSTEERLLLESIETEKIERK
ncbi:MAG: chemotaxis protein CheW [Nitrospirota bacterium]